MARKAFPSWVVLGCLVGGLLTLGAGCGDGLPERVPVAGQVLVDGEPLKVGSVRLVPANGRPAVGEVDQDGRFVLSTFGVGDGCVLGSHKVTVHSLEGLGGNSQRWNVPKKYASPATSGITKTIDGPTDDLLIEVTWDGDRPFVERFSGE